MNNLHEMNDTVVERPNSEANNEANNDVKNEANLGAARPTSGSRRARLQALLFTGAAVGTTLLTLAGADPKLPPFNGE